VRLKSDETKRDATRPEFREVEKCHALRGELSWTHYRLLLRVENEKEGIMGNKKIKSSKTMALKGRGPGAIWALVTPDE